MEVRREMSGELKDVRKKLEESLKEMEILKRRALGLEDENKYLVSIPTKDKKKNTPFISFCGFSSIFQTDVDEAVRRLKAENSLLQIQLTDSKAVEDDSQATIANQEITIDSLKKEKEVWTHHLFFPQSVLICTTDYLCSPVLNGEHQKDVICYLSPA